MSWWLARTLAAVLAVGAGGLLGWLLGSPFDLPRTLAMVGATTAVGLVAMLDALRGDRVMEWLRSPKLEHVPQTGGLWGELAYRVERTLRNHEAEAVRERERLQQFLSAIEASPNGVLMLDEQSRVVWLNSVAAEHFGLNPRRDLQQRVTNLVRAPAFVAYLQAGQFEAPISFAGPSGRMTLSVLIRGYGDGQRLVLSLDITERERADAMRRDFVANVSHEIRSPLTVLAGFVETMAGLPLTEAERKRVLVLMGQQTDRMQSLVSDLLTLAKLEGSPRPSAEHWVSLFGLLQRAHTDGQALSGGRHELLLQGGEEVEIAGQPGELASAIGNLVNNAVRYTPDGGRIELNWRWNADGGGLIEVSDSGIGIAKEHLPRLTERFYRVDGSRSRDTGGTGLGLSIVKHVVQRHGGSIDVRSETGKGSCFVLQFPAGRLRLRAKAVLEASSSV